MRNGIPVLTLALLILTGLGLTVLASKQPPGRGATEMPRFFVVHADGTAVPDGAMAWVDELATRLAADYQAPVLQETIATYGRATAYAMVLETATVARNHGTHLPGADALPFTMPEGTFYWTRDGGALFQAPEDAHVPLPYYEGLAAVGTFGPPDPDGLTAYTFRYIDRAGKTVIPGPFERALPFVDGIATVAVRDDGGAVKYGTIDRSGAWQIPPTFDLLFEFNNGLAAAQMDNPDHTAQQAGFVNPQGEFVVTLEKVQRMQSSHHDGLALVWRTEAPEYVFVDREGKVVLTPDYDQVEPFSEGRAAVLRGEQWGYIDTKGMEVIPPKYFMAHPFLGDVAAVVTVPDGHTFDDHFTIEIPLEE
jgi:hypothetical protein